MDSATTATTATTATFSAPTAVEPRGRLAALLDDAHPATAQLKQYGYAIVRVCSEDRAHELSQGCWADLEALGTGIDRHRPETWTNAKWPQTTHGLLQNQGAGLWRGTAEARLETEALWTSLFRGKRCISSFDALSVARPDSQTRAYLAELANQKKFEESELLSSWLHTDQAKGKSECLIFIQGALALTHLGQAEQRTQLVVPKEGSETMQSFRDRFLAAFPAAPVAKGKFDPEREEWVKHSAAERKWLLEHGRVVTPELAPGEMILWDSGVPHASIPGPLPIPGNVRVEGSGVRKVRMSVFVSALPLKLVIPDDLKVRRAMLEHGDTSGHRVTTRGKNKPFLACKFSETGRTYGKEVPVFSKKRKLSNFKDAFEAGLVDADSADKSITAEESARIVAAKTARFCGGY